MKIAVAREIKTHEYRVGVTPTDAKAYIDHGHSVQIEKSAGEQAGFPDSDYRQVGASITSDRAALFAQADMIIKVKEPQPSEYELFRDGQILYTSLLLGAELDLTQALLVR